ncbi:MAG TPA: FGGY-family carbohydrate kinase [Candidatus Binatia bacterium]|nr:FGGY-family carbohydrate kinase [Candidatus Binatia bacterium]
MSLVGIDVGSSAVKAAAYSDEGQLLAAASGAITSLYPSPGQWETDPLDLWRAMSQAMQELGAQEALRRDPVRAIAISASGRENFPADAAGIPLGNGLMGADVRGEEFEAVPPNQFAPEGWCLRCGHPRERMDPVFRLAWWKKCRPEIMDKARYFFGWIDFLTFRMTGRAVMDISTASRYAVFDLEDGTWNQERIRAFEVDPALLPTLQPWGTIVGELKTDVAAEWNFPPGVVVAQGCHDLNCAAYGAGVCDKGVACLVSGSYENVLVVSDQLPTAPMLRRGLSVMPQPCKAGLSVIAVHPTGNAVLNWARQLLALDIEEMDSSLTQTRTPSAVMAIPYLSGAMAYWEDGRKARGGVLNMTLATRGAEIVQAFMESIAYDTRNTLALMKKEGIAVERIRITGGGARSAWWTQLKADVTNVPVEVVRQPEPGTLGAALLAGVAIGSYNDMEAISRALSGTSRVYEPDAARASQHYARMETYHATVAALLQTA